MPKGIRCTDVLFCRACKKQLTPQQIVAGRKKRGKAPTYCCYRCSRGIYNSKSLQEPESEEEARLFQLQIAEGRKQVTTDLQRVVQAQSPVDDSPAAEKRLRMELCPNPLYFCSSVGYQDRVVK